MAFIAIAEINLVSYLTMLTSFLSESGMMEWSDKIPACTGDYMAGAYVDQPSQKPWESPPS